MLLNGLLVCKIVCLLRQLYGGCFDVYLDFKSLLLGGFLFVLFSLRKVYVYSTGLPCRPGEIRSLYQMDHCGVLCFLFCCLFSLELPAYLFCLFVCFVYLFVLFVFNLMGFGAGEGDG